MTMDDKNAMILCVDDEKIVLDTLVRQLEQLYADTFLYEQAQSVEEAWEIIDEATEDGMDMVLVISDWLMPGTRGDEFLVELHNRYPNTVKIMLSGQADKEAIDNAIANSNTTYFSKPWRIDQLKSYIDNTGMIAA